MKAVYASTGADLAEIAFFGFDTVIGSFSLSELDKMGSFGLKCIYHGEYLDHDNILAYYLYDEPDYNKISIEEQDKKISYFRSCTSKPLAIACVEQSKRLCSSNYDWYMLDIYFLTELGRLSTVINYLNIAISPFMVMALYKGKKVLPIIGLYDDLTEFKYTEKCVPFAIKFRAYFRTELDFAVFIWQGNGSTYFGVRDRSVYLKATSYLTNIEQKKCWYITYKILSALGASIIFIRGLIPDKALDWVNSKLPKNLKVKS